MPHDLDRAKRLMAQAGHEDGLEIRMKVPKMPGVPIVGQLAALIREQVAKVGVVISLEELEVGTFIANAVLPGNFDIAFFPQLPYDEPDRPLSFYHPRGVFGGLSWNYAGRPDFKDLVNPDIVTLIDAQSVDVNAESRTESILRVQRLILKERGPQITLPSGYFYNAHWKYVYNPYHAFLGDRPNQNSLPGVDMWTEEA
jgi:ABC-type transport system substrate-binding protein